MMEKRLSGCNRWRVLRVVWVMSSRINEDYVSYVNIILMREYLLGRGGVYIQNGVSVHGHYYIIGISSRLIS